MVLCLYNWFLNLMQEEEPYPRQPDNDNEDDDSFFAKEDKSE